MRKFLFAVLAIGMVASLAGCSSKNRPVLYEPGATSVWPTTRQERTRPGAQPEQRLPRVELITNKGTIIIELFKDEAPVSVANFLSYVRDGYYDGLIFHRVEPAFVIQGGGFTADLETRETRPPIINEAGNGLRNMRGTVAMARTGQVNSATSQFFINLVDNFSFNGDGILSGYAVFGRVYEGMDVVDAIAVVDTTSVGPLDNVPAEPVIIESARVVE